VRSKSAKNLETGKIMKYLYWTIVTSNTGNSKKVTRWAEIRQKMEAHHESIGLVVWKRKPTYQQNLMLFF